MNAVGRAGQTAARDRGAVGAGGRRVPRVAPDQVGAGRVRLEPERATSVYLQLERLVVGGAEEVGARCRACVSAQLPEAGRVEPVQQVRVQAGDLGGGMTLSGATELLVTIDWRPGPPPKFRPVTPAEPGSVEAVWPQTPGFVPVDPI